MVGRFTIHQLIDNAIESRTSVFIRYRDYHGKISDREVSPLDWVEPEKFLAFCHLRNEERHFRTSNIVEIKKTILETFDPLDEGLPIQPSVDTINARFTPRPATAYATKTAIVDRVNFSKVNTSEEWSRLLGYYHECLCYEYQQQFSFPKRSLFQPLLDDTLVYSFITAKSNIVYSRNDLQGRRRDFFDISRHKNQQLCLGKSFVCFSEEKISPLLFVPVSIDLDSPGRVILKAEELNLSYAALMSLRFDAEEIADFLKSFQTYVDNQPTIQDIERFVIQALSDRLTRPLSVISSPTRDISSTPDYAIYEGAGLFWASSEFTGNLIAELKNLAGDNVWVDVPAHLKILFGTLPAVEHAPAPDFIEDRNFYVTNINAQQRKAARAVDEHSVTIVTGPPGTGKSQLVLNLIAQAYLNGDTVLFASHNNKAVDVVMDRLQGEINFQGAIRTGSKPNRKKAVGQMKNAIAQIHRPVIRDFEVRYQDGKRVLKKADEQLNLIHDLKGKIQSYQLEKDEVLAGLSLEQQARLADLVLPYKEIDKQDISAFISGMIDEFRSLNHAKQKLTSQLREILRDKENYHSATDLLQGYESRWGRFADGILHKTEFQSISELIESCSQLQKIVEILPIKKELEEIRKKLNTIKQDIDEKSSLMTEEENSTALLLLDHRTEEQLISEQNWINEFKTKITVLKERRFSWIQKIGIALRLYRPKKELIKIIQEKRSALEIPEISFDEREGVYGDIDAVVVSLISTYELCFLLRELSKEQQILVGLEGNYDDRIKALPASLDVELDRLDLRTYVNTSLAQDIGEINQQAEIHLKNLNANLEKCVSFFLKNSSQNEFIPTFQAWVDQKEGWEAFGLGLHLSEIQALIWAQTWQKILVLWEANAVIQHSLDQLSQLPTEEQALLEYQAASRTLFTLAGELMRATWFSRASNVPNEILEGTYNYISAVEQLVDLDYGHNPTLYRSLKTAERDNFAYAIQMFPVWAITNLTARSNFPLDPALFDLVIIDEASQCDIPSAIPLMFRSNKAVIIGDPNQLRHVATLTSILDAQLGRKYGIGLESFSYTTLSLYDVGERCVGRHPGPILLDEHYRSDPRIITFPNEEFYGGQLKIMTDLPRLGYQKDYLIKRGGAFWLNVKGDFHRSQNGSAFNTEELQKIQSLVPKLLNQLDRDGLRKASIGVVTPFRAQEAKIRDWLNQAYPTSSRIKSGTAHQFQGDECDVIIFSPVLSAGILEGTLNWLEETYNLLNVAITRARVCLIIVGDFNYCYHDLPRSSRYCKLAKYIKHKLAGVYEIEKDLPVFGGERFEILGMMLNPVNPEFNRTSLIRFIASCQEYIYWIDPYFDQGIVDLFDELFDGQKRPAINEIRLITAERQVKHFLGKPPQLRPESFLRLQEDLKSIGVTLCMRILPGEELPHDRFLYHPGGAINMPPFAGAYGKHMHVSEYTTSKTTVEDFEMYWKKGIPINEY